MRRTSTTGDMIVKTNLVAVGMILANSIINTTINTNNANSTISTDSNDSVISIY